MTNLAPFQKIRMGPIFVKIDKPRDDPLGNRGCNFSFYLKIIDIEVK